MKNLTRILTALLAMVLLQSCSDLLRRTEPPTSISQEIALSDPGAIEAIRASMYDRFHSFDYTTELMLGGDALADNLENRSGSSRFQGFTQNQVGAGLSSWNTAYNAILDANLLIGGIEEGVLDDEELSMFRGEAHFVRAFALWHLVRVFGYEPGRYVDGWDRGVIIRTEPTLNVSDADLRARNSVPEVYTQMKSDLQQAITLLGESQSSSRFFIQQAAAYALLARVNLYEGSYAAANEAAGNALGTTNATLVTTEDGVEDMFNEGAGLNPEAIFTVLVDPATESQGVNNSLNAYTAQQWVAQVPTQDLIDLYDADDWRNAWYAPCFDDVNNTAVTGCPAGLETQKWNGEKGQFADDIPHFRVAELILIQAEARLKTEGVGQGLERLNTLRAARGLGTLTFVTGDADAVMREILDERRRELAAEGHRFFDLKRLGMDIRKPPSSSFPTVSYNDFKILDNLPESEIEINPKLEQNPGY